MKRIASLYKNAYSGLSRATWWLSLVMLINRAGTMVLPFMTLYLTDVMHYRIADAGKVMACFGMGAICGGFLGGRLTDKFGFYNIQLSSLICGGVMFIVLGQMKSFPSICGCAFLLALLNDSFRPANATAIAQYSKEENRTRSFSLNRLSVNLGWAVGGAAGGFIASHNYHLLFWIDGLTNIAAAIMLRLVLSPSRNSQPPAKKVRERIPDTRQPHKDKLYLVFILLTILFGLCFFQIFATLPVFYRQALHLSPFFIGMVMAVNGLLIVFFEMALIFSLESRQKNIHYIAIGALLVGVSYVVFNILPGEKMLALFSIIIVTAGEMLSMPFMNTFWISRTDDNNRGQYAGLYTAAWSIAQVMGPYAGTQVVQRFGFHTLWWVLGSLSLVTALGFKWLQARQAGERIGHKKGSGRSAPFHCL
jgi:predicted MFS family arabinose efflux permease